MSNAPLRVLIVAESASAKFGGEAALPLHYFRLLRRRGAEAWLIVHERTREELSVAMPTEMDRVTFIPDTQWHQWLWVLSKPLPARLSYFTVGFAMRLLTQFVQRQLIRAAIAEHQITVIHQPMPVSPKEPSMIFGFGVPVIIGPMNGGMDYPSAFRQLQGRFEWMTITAGRLFSNFLNWVMPGKRQAAALLVANPRTQAALPGGSSRNVIELVENGVDLSVWKPGDKLVDVLALEAKNLQALSRSGTFFGLVGTIFNRRRRVPEVLSNYNLYWKLKSRMQLREPFDAVALIERRLQQRRIVNLNAAEPTPIRFIFIGRLVDWKAVDLLLHAVKRVADHYPIHLEIIGDGVERLKLEALALSLNLISVDDPEVSVVSFAGWLAQRDCAQRLLQADAMVLPSLMECGGAVVLEAMAMAVPVIATNWGGPTDYLNSTCGILVDPSSREEFIAGLAKAMARLAESPELRWKLGWYGRQRILREFDWEVKLDRMLEIYQQVLETPTEKDSMPPMVKPGFVGAS